MKQFKRIMAMLLIAVLAFSVIGCSDKNPASEQQVSGDNDTEEVSVKDSLARVDIKAADPNAKQDEITIGTWWLQYYDSACTALDDDPSYDPDATPFNLKVAEMKLDNVKNIEEKWGLKFYWDNITYAGVKDSINTSILAGSPDEDVYLVEVGFGLPAQAKGLALDLKTVLPADSDIFTDKNVVDYLDIGDGRACIFYRVAAETSVEATYPLAFNVQMLQEAGLEDPRDLYERNEWTWDKFIEYCQKLTKDTDGDGEIDQYGYCGFSNETFAQLMMSNGASIATSSKQTLTTTPVAEALQMMQDMYTLYKVCYPYDYQYDVDGNSTGASPSDTMRFQYRDGNIAFYPGAAWINAQNSDYDYQGKNGVTLPFDTAYVRWPVGPSGDRDTNYGKNGVDGQFFIIPAGVAEPEKVYGVMYDYWNWYDFDIDLRDDREILNWWYLVTSKTEENQKRNFDVMNDCGKHTGLDLWNSLNFYYDLDAIIRGNMTPAQFQETYKQQVQDALDVFFGN